SDEERLKTAAEDEYRRLLYVAMTRAADHLVVCGYRGQKENPECWHAIVKAALAENQDHCQPQAFSADGEEWQGLVWRKSEARPALAPHKPAEPQQEEDHTLPPGLLAPLPALPSLPRPLSPSGAGTIIDDGADDLAVRSPLFGEKTEASSLALQRGKLVHRMLQALPDFAESEREEAARRYAERAARFWPATDRERLIQAVLRVLSEPAVQPAFSANSRAEVSIMGTMTLGRQHYAVSGRIDRLAVERDRVILVDYKTNRVPPREARELPFSHVAQLAIYREILAPLYPGKEFVCALIYTESA
ncbi:PD-(D/E)XK nuclease family protein, partial [Pseudomonas fluorescens]